MAPEPSDWDTGWGWRAAVCPERRGMPGERIRLRSCAVIGAGVLGACLAARLAEAGVEVTLLERDTPASGATRLSFAWLNSNNKQPRVYHDLNQAGLEAWARLTGSMDSASWYHPAGNLEWEATPDATEQLAARVERLAGWGYPARLISAAEAAGLEPSLRLPDPAPAVAWFPDEGYLLTAPLVSALVERARQYGASVLTGEQGRVIGLDVAGGAMRLVRTATGRVAKADAVVCCAGRWTPELAALAGAEDLVPLVGWAGPGAAAPGLVVQAGPVTPPGPGRVVHSPEVYLRPHSGGLVHLEAPDVVADLETAEPELARWAEELLRRARLVVGGLDEARVTAYRICVRPMPSDGQTIAGPLPGAAGMYVAVTHSGVTLAAHLAELITAELTSGEPAPALAPYRPERFAGQRITSS